MSNQPPGSNVRTRSVGDPLALRALAHPLRLRLHELVAREGSLTAADAARQLDVSHALASHHLRQLAKYGFVEPAEAPDGRAHPWRVTSTSMDLTPSDAGGRAATDVMQRHSAEQALEQLVDWQRRRDGEDPRWADLAGATGGLLYLTPEELREVLRSFQELVEPLALRRPVGHADQRPPEAVPVRFSLVAVPVTPTEHGG